MILGRHHTLRKGRPVGFVDYRNGSEEAIYQFGVAGNSIRMNGNGQVPEDVMLSALDYAGTLLHIYGGNGADRKDRMFVMHVPTGDPLIDVLMKAGFTPCGMDGDNVLYEKPILHWRQNGF